MSVRIKVLIIICLTFLAMLGVLYFTSQWFLFHDSNITDEQNTTQDTTRLVQALNNQIEGIDATVSDWAPWDDTYEFITSGDPGYIASNLPNDSAFTNIQVELMLFIDNSGQIVYGKMVDLAGAGEIPIPKSLYSELHAGSRLLSHKDPTDKLAGILFLPEGPMIIASQPIVTSQGKGPIRGTLIMGRRLDEAEIAQLSQATQLSISVFPYNGDGVPSDVALAQKSLVGGKTTFIASQSDSVLSGYALVNDVYGSPALILRVEAQREAYAQAKMSMRYLGLALLSIGIVLGLVTMLLLERLVTVRLTSLNASVMKIGSQGSAASRVKASGNDEIFVLATSVNSMLDSLENSTAKERESEARFSSIFNSSPIPVSLTDPATERWVEVNDAFLNATGFTRDETIGHTFQDLQLWVHPEKRMEMKKMLLEKGRVHNFEVDIHKKNGTTGTMLLSVEMITLNKAPFLLIMGDEITERKQAEEALKEYNTRLAGAVEARTLELNAAQEKLVRQEKLAVLGQLAGGVGHELRNPLGVINNAVYYLKLVQPEADETIRKYHAMIEHEVHNADKIIADLLDFARIRSVDRERVAVPELVQRVLERFPVPESITTRLEIPADLPGVYADPRQMEQVLGNLVTNACQAMEDAPGASGPPTGGKLTLSASLQGDMIAIAVQDTGTGIPPENMGKLFEPLFTTKTKGIGLGLAVSQRLVEANGGRIEASSQPGHGSTFTVTLPVYKEEIGPKTSHPHRR